MKLIGLYLCKNEEWVLEASLRSALCWVDELIVVDHSSTDSTDLIINRLCEEYPFRVNHSRWTKTKKEKTYTHYGQNGKLLPDGYTREIEIDVPDEGYKWWDEMDARQHSLELGRKHKGTHFAIIDADEILTANALPYVRSWFSWLQPGQILEVPMLAMRNLHEYQDDDSVWSRAFLTLGFADVKDILSWKPASDGYHHHHRAPHGVSKNPLRAWTNKSQGGVMHLQWCNEKRLKAKHVLYRMIDHLRWPNRETTEELNRKYNEALITPAKTSQVSQEWWAGQNKDLINTNGWPWQDMEVRRLLSEYGREAFAGLDLLGMY